MKMDTTERKRNGEQGNVLFLILIAVALFAALSYAVTQSTRSGGGDAARETNLVNSAQLTQYPAGIRTSLVRMIIGGTAIDSPVTFNSPSDFGGLTAAELELNAFHPTGGGATYQLAPSDLVLAAATVPGTWYFNANFEIPNIGTNGAGGNDLIAFLPDVPLAMCNRINEELGITALTTWDPTDANYEDSILDGDAFPGVAAETFDAGLTGQPFGCFADSSTTPDMYIYYHVLIER